MLFRSAMLGIMSGRELWELARQEEEEGSVLSGSATIYHRPPTPSHHTSHREVKEN